MPWTLGPPIVLIPLTIRRGGLYYPGWKLAGQEHVVDKDGRSVKVEEEKDGKRD